MLDFPGNLCDLSGFGADLTMLCGKRNDSVGRYRECLVYMNNVSH